MGSQVGVGWQSWGLPGLARLGGAVQGTEKEAQNRNGQKQGWTYQTRLGATAAGSFEVEIAGKVAEGWE